MSTPTDSFWTLCVRLLFSNKFAALLFVDYLQLFGADLFPTDILLTLQAMSSLLAFLFRLRDVARETEFLLSYSFSPTWRGPTYFQ